MARSGPMPTEGVVAYAQFASGGSQYDGWKFRKEDGKTYSFKDVPRSKTITYPAYDFERVVKATGIKHWIRKNGWWIPDPKGKSLDRPCCQRVSTNERWSHYGPCDRKITRDGLCGPHAAGRDRTAARREAEGKKAEAGAAGKRIAQDAVEVLSGRGIKSKPHYAIPIGSSARGQYDGRVEVHAEDVIALVRRLEHLEEVMGIEPGAEL